MEGGSAFGVWMLRRALSYVAARTVCITAVVRRPGMTSDAFIARRPVNCVPLSLDRYGRTVATCSAAGKDLGEWLVRNGLALDWPQ
ncbi:thermonuclease family protein [Bradyrhizobium sp. NBAIM01]|uniref:thermonuclease family protein n=1 Tax=Bradyrhizobium sp. NBAIM01 TaxID=2793818 RepID=UPI0032097FE2